MRSRVVQPCFRLIVNGSKLPSWMYSSITKVTFKETDGNGANQTFDVEFDDPELQVMESGLFVEKQTSIVCEMGYIKDYETIFLGIVESVENDYPTSGKITLKITARDVGYLMSEDEKNIAWKGKTYSDIVKEICANYGLACVSDDTSDILPRMANVAASGETVNTGTPQQATNTYTVKSGDTLSAISKRVYGNSGMWNKIYEANKSIIKNPNLIYPNQVLTIPDGSTNTVQPATPVAATELATVNQSGVSDLKFMQNLASICNYQLVIDSSNKKCWFVKPTTKIKELEEVGLDYKSGNELLKSFTPKFNDYDKAMSVKAYNINIDNNVVVTGEEKPPLASAEQTTVGNNPPQQPTNTYTVKSGDCLWSISKKVYGNGNMWNKIYEANKSIIKNPNLIYPNQVLTIP